MSQEWFCCLSAPIRYAALIDNVVHELYSFNGSARLKYLIADHVLRNSEAMKESCYVEMYDIIQWQEAYMFTKLTEQNKRRDNRPNAMP